MSQVDASEATPRSDADAAAEYKAIAARAAEIRSTLLPAFPPARERGAQPTPTVGGVARRPSAEAEERAPARTPSTQLPSTLARATTTRGDGTKLVEAGATTRRAPLVTVNAPHAGGKSRTVPAPPPAARPTAMLKRGTASSKAVTTKSNSSRVPSTTAPAPSAPQSGASGASTDR